MVDPSSLDGQNEREGGPERERDKVEQHSLLNTDVILEVHRVTLRFTFLVLLPEAALSSVELVTVVWMVMQGTRSVLLARSCKPRVVIGTCICKVP